MCDGKPVESGTDNFELSVFHADGVTFYSAEQAYQAWKMEDSKARDKIVARVPRPGEKAWDYGMAIWNMGQRGMPVPNWEAHKVEAMYRANKMKLEQNPTLLATLLATRAQVPGKLTHRGSGKFWDKWNPLILTCIREELSSPREESLVLELHAMIEEYKATTEASRGNHGGVRSSKQKKKKAKEAAGESTTDASAPEAGRSVPRSVEDVGAEDTDDGVVAGNKTVKKWSNQGHTAATFARSSSFATVSTPDEEADPWHQPDPQTFQQQKQQPAPAEKKRIPFASDKRLRVLLERQARKLPGVLRELQQNGRKTSHWAWWAFPTEKEGFSEPPPRTALTPDTAKELLELAPAEWRQVLELLAVLVDENGIDVLPTIDHGRVKFFSKFWTSLDGSPPWMLHVCQVFQKAFMTMPKKLSKEPLFNRAMLLKIQKNKRRASKSPL